MNEFVSLGPQPDDESIIIDDKVYRISILDGNHGAWLFLYLGEELIWEQPGHASYNDAYVEGKLYAQWHAVQPENQAGYVAPPSKWTNDK